MTEKKQPDDLESFTFRLPAWLKENIGRIKTTLSIPTMSDAARFVMEKGAGELEKTIGDTRELLELQRHEQAALQKIVAKWRQNQPFSRAELAFIAQWAHSAYMLVKTKNVRRDPLKANLEAFHAILSLRKERYRGTDELSGLDRYYLGNLGNYSDDSLPKRLDEVITNLKDFPYCSQAEFASRCLEVALRDEPILPVDRLNELLRPHLPSLIKLALRGYYYYHDNTTALPVETTFSGKPMAMKHPMPVTRGNMYVGPNILGDSITAAISWEKGNVLVSVNGFLELSELLILIGAAPHEHTVSGQRFMFIPPTPPVNQYLMRVDGVQIMFADEEFNDMQTALRDVMQQQVMTIEYERLSWLYGDI